VGPSDPSPTEILDRLVSFDTTSHKTNIPLITYVKDYLSEHGISSDLVPDESGDKASLFATIGPAEMPGIGLSGHTDVVPVAGQEWATDPFCLTEKDGKLYGRGSADMKGFLACVLAAAPKLRQRDFPTMKRLAVPGSAR
jgi:acetylornithine deacetylase